MFNPKDHIITTERLILRPLEERDRELVVSLYTDPKVMRNIAKPFSDEESHQYFERCKSAQAQNPATGIVWVLCQQEDQQAIGIIAFYTLTPSKANIGIMLLRGANGQLYPEEAMAAIMQHGYNKLGLKEIHAHFFTRNLATKRFVTKLGFEFLPLAEGADSYHCVCKAENWSA